MLGRGCVLVSRPMLGSNQAHTPLGAHSSVPWGCVPVRYRACPRPRKPHPGPRPWGLTLEMSAGLFHLGSSLAQSPGPRTRGPEAGGGVAVCGELGGTRLIWAAFEDALGR